MKNRWVCERIGSLVFAFSIVLALFVALPAAYAQESAQAQKNAKWLKAYVTVKPAGKAVAEGIKQDVASTGNSNKASLPLFTFNVQASRDGNDYTGVMVGKNPFKHGGTANIKTFIIPVVFTLNSVGVSFDPNTGIIGTAPGTTVFDPTAADNACLSSPNNVPSRLFRQSPIFEEAIFDFGGTIVGNTQYVDAFQRGNFWNVEDQEDFHTLLNPVKMLPAIQINVPADSGLTLPSADFPSCGPFGIVDFFFLDNLLTGTILPALASQGVNASNFPTFLMYNVVLASPVTQLGTCCVLGYHGATSNLPIQTYSPIDFDTTGLFGPAVSDTTVAAHEVAEWMDDPFGNNPVPLWGGGQVGAGFCQGNLEDGDPLTGTNAPPIVMDNGFTYHLQELVFFSWFFGTPSIGIHGWFSDNATFLHDAGPVCVPAAGSSTNGGRPFPIPTK
ncbi:MAG TPA: hypothetical protein VEU52_02605 [Candidatus Limnocylindrales bacterium]|nr:hypothetical protein [Candidatus Limnocylindrales bacterium]